MITINNAYNVGDKIFLFRNGTIVSDTIKSIKVYDFTLDAKNQNPPKARYSLANTIGTFYECELHSSPQEIVKHLQQQVKGVK